MKLLVGVFLMGGLGAISRYLISLSVPMPFGTFIVNIIGCFFMALVLEKLSSRWSLEKKTAISTGFIGAFTTFSTFSVENIRLAQTMLVLSLLYTVASLGLGILAALAGFRIAKGNFWWGKTSSGKAEPGSDLQCSVSRVEGDCVEGQCFVAKAGFGDCKDTDDVGVAGIEPADDESRVSGADDESRVSGADDESRVSGNDDESRVSGVDDKDTSSDVGVAGGHSKDPVSNVDVAGADGKDIVHDVNVDDGAKVIDHSNGRQEAK